MKINKILIITIISFLFSGCINEQTPKHVKLAHKIMRNIAKDLRGKYNLKLIVTGGSMMDSIEVIQLGFTSIKKVNIDEARKLILECSKIFIDDINNLSGIQPYLANYPATGKNIELDIYFRIYDKVQPPNIAVVSNCQGIIIYYYDENDILKTVLKETYQEALKKAGMN